MAKRKSTDKSSKNEVEDQVDTPDVSDAQDTAETDSDTPTATEDTVKDAALQGDDTLSADNLSNEVADDTVIAEITDDTIELSEPTDDSTPSEDGSDVVEANAEADEATKEGETLDSELTEPTEDTAALADEDHISEEEAERLLEEAETTEASAEPAEPAEETQAEEPVAPQVIRETTVEKKAGFVPTVLGGVVAAALGYGGAAYVSQSVWPFNAGADDSFEVEMRDAMAAQSSSLTEITDRLTTLEGIEPPVFDPSPLQAEIAAVQEAAAGITAQLTVLDARIEALEKQPLEQAVSPEAIAAYERALTDLQAEVDAQRAEVSQMAQEALAAEGNAEEQAQLAAARAALADVTTALDTGAEFTEAIGILSANGVNVPEALSANAESGIATQGSLIETFPSVARAALSAARSDATENAEGTNRVATFFANQLGARSVAPREGDDPDAVLSRAEAAVRDGNLDTALSELSALPEAAQAAVADWQASASTRLEAKTAADALVQQLLQE